MGNPLPYNNIFLAWKGNKSLDLISFRQNLIYIKTYHLCSAAVRKAMCTIALNNTLPE